MDNKSNSESFFSNFNRYSEPKLPDPSSSSSSTSEQQSLDLSWVFAVFRRRLWIMGTISLVLIVILSSLIIKKSRQVIPEYQGSFRLLVEPVTAEARIANVSLLAQTDPNEALKQGRLDISLVDYASLVRILKSPKLLDPAIKEIQTRYPGITYNSLAAKLLIEQVSYLQDAKTEGTSLVKVTYGGLEVDKIKFVLEHLANTYLQYSLEERVASINQGIEFIESQLPKLEKTVQDNQQAVKKFREKYHLIDPTDQNRELSVEARQLEQSRIQLETDLAMKKAGYETLKQQLASGNIIGILSPTETSYRTLISKLQDIEASLAVESSRLKADSLPLQLLRQQQANLRSLLQQEAERVVDMTGRDVQILEASLASLYQAEEELKQEIQEWPYITVKYAELQRQLEVSTETLKEFQTKLQSLKITASQVQQPWQIIDPPDVLRDAEGNVLNLATQSIRKQLLLVGVVSMLLGVGVGFLVEILITVFHRPEEVQTATQLPILATIPVAKALKKRQLQSKQLVSNFVGAGATSSSSQTPLKIYPYSGYSSNYAVIAEAFRTLYTNISLLTSGRGLHSLVISSPSTGDGKSTVAICLAKTAAAVGKRVLLVDADLRQPQIHQKLGLPNLRGFSEAIVSDLGLNDAIQRAPEEENLFVLTAGQVPEDPIKLLSSKKKQYLMEQFQAFFDLVIYDTPPLLELADANLIAVNTDGVVLVVKMARTDRAKVTKALDGFKISGATVLGIVANGLKGQEYKVSGSYSNRQRN